MGLGPETLLYVLCFLTLITLLISAFDTIFRVSYAKAQIKIQEEEAKKISEQMSKMEDEQAEVDEAMKSEKFSELGKLGGAVKQRQMVDSGLNNSFFQSQDIQMGLAALESFSPDLYEKVKDKPDLIMYALEKLKGFSNSSSKDIQLINPTQRRTPNNGSSNIGW